MLHKQQTAHQAQPINKWKVKRVSITRGSSDIRAMLENYIKTDIYVLDQILKGRYSPGCHLLDAGTGSGRNLTWFAEKGCRLTLTEVDPERKKLVDERFPGMDYTWLEGDLAELRLNALADHAICSAVLHFARDSSHFQRMLSAVIHAVKPGGSILIRTCCLLGMEGKVEALGNGRYRLPDDSERYLMTRAELAELESRDDVALLEPIKWTTVAELRTMLTLVLEKRDSD